MQTTVGLREGYADEQRRDNSAGDGSSVKQYQSDKHDEARGLQRFGDGYKDDEDCGPSKDNADGGTKA